MERSLGMNAFLRQFVLVVVCVVVIVCVSGCVDANRSTNGGSLLRIGGSVNVDLFPSDTSDTGLFFGTTDALDVKANAPKGTNAHDAGIRKEQIRASVAHTSSTSPGNVSQDDERAKYRN